MQIEYESSSSDYKGSSIKITASDLNEAFILGGLMERAYTDKNELVQGGQGDNRPWLRIPLTPIKQPTT